MAIDGTGFRDISIADAHGHGIEGVDTIAIAQRAQQQKQARQQQQHGITIAELIRSFMTDPHLPQGRAVQHGNEILQRTISQRTQARMLTLGIDIGGTAIKAPPFTASTARGRPKLASMAGPSRCMKAPASRGSSAVIGEPWDRKIGLGADGVCMPRLEHRGAAVRFSAAERSVQPHARGAGGLRLPLRP